jgi:hypothetical protein
MVAMGLHRPADHFLGLAAIIAIRRIDEIDALIARLVDDAGRCGFVGRPAEHHRAEAQGRNLQGTAAEIAIVHDPAFLSVRHRWWRV